VTTLGSFTAFRGAAAIPPSAWRRAKARQMFQVLLTFRSSPLDREQIIELLWPGLDPAAAVRNFKVTLNTLNHVLEPERGPGSEPAFILRDGSHYCLRPGADLWLDAEAFTCQVARAEALLQSDRPAAASLLEQALNLYQGDYLPDALYENWAAVERERLEVIFLRAADRLADMYLAQGQYEQAIELATRILQADNCWERAYRQLMLAHQGLGNRGQIGRVFQRCTHILKEELDVVPAEETRRLFEQLTAEAGGKG
jgi:DNA-binding SARP family transcriptional activator